MQDRRALLHRHLAVAHVVELSQAHFIICSISVGASKIFFCNITGLRDRVSSIFSHPNNTGSRLGASSSKASFQIHVCKCARFTFSVKASVVGGSEHSFGAIEGDFPTFDAQIRWRTADILSETGLCP